jgi:hypothetical protein
MPCREEKIMAVSSVYQWILEGKLHVWYYLPRVKGLDGWHLNANTMACTSIVDLVDRMLGADGKSQKRIPVSMPARMLVGPGHPWKSVSALVLRYPMGEVEDDFWHMELVEGDVVTLTVGSASLRELRQSLLNLPNWKDDFALGPKATGNRLDKRAAEIRFPIECLWFWTKVE